MANAGIRATQTYAYLLDEAGGYPSVGFTKIDCQNLIQVERLKRMAAGDGQIVINYFKRNQIQNPMFFYTVQVDEENRMTNFFWRDGISKLDYECFGDVVVFDTTYRTNKYNMICAPFVGVNHHWKNVLFGCAFLCDETAASFVWLFDAFLQSMDYKAPKTIFTDQDHAMAKAIAQVLPNTKHRLCQWHISKNAAVNIFGLLHEQGFRNMFNFWMYKCDNESEFEETWKKMVEAWGCSNQSWLLKLYDIRDKWAPAFSRDIFSCNISSSQRSDSTNNVFQHMACKTLALAEFVHHYEKNAEKMREAEVTDDFKCVHGKPTIISRGSGILKHACKVYTNKIFSMFQDEFLQTTSYSVAEHISNDALHLYKIRREDGTRDYILHFNSENCTISCSCKLFESLGLLCCHALRVLNLNDVKTIPEQYILDRWTKVVKEGYNTERPTKVAQDNSGDSVKTLRLNRLMRKAFTLMNLAATLDGTTEIAERNMDRT